MMMYYLTSSSHLNAEQTGQNTFIVHLSNGKVIEVVEQPTYRERAFAWKVDRQYFSNDASALSYLDRLIAEKLTGKRIIYHAKQSVPEICSAGGAACCAPGEYDRALCYECPVAEAFFAQRDGVELVYAIKENNKKENKEEQK